MPREQGEIDREALIQLMKPLQAEIRKRLEHLWDDPETPWKRKGTAKDLLRQWDSLWNYIHREGAVPTNTIQE